ncbi:alpha/beta hydrolase [Aequorivita capsosiphonis]|uniref:alpha/beta hydrolase n=1 Tax=Aequorivita capsosiphonis TaxID=487317 RepID=UPI0004048534|nr:alpha/beta hydrolase [Aequorivita capsosiphonis]
MKSKLIILTDLWGLADSSWLDQYKVLLEPHFELKIYDSCKLAGIESTALNEKQIHAHFINYGIKTAVENLVKLEKAPVHILAFSIGGTIAWKAGLNGLNIINLYALSSTRLRYETEKPDCKIHLLFGEKDTFSPKEEWIASLNLELEIIKDGAHEVYKNEKISIQVSEQIKRSIL